MNVQLSNDQSIIMHTHTKLICTYNMFQNRRYAERYAKSNFHSANLKKCYLRKLIYKKMCIEETKHTEWISIL